MSSVKQFDSSNIDYSKISVTQSGAKNGEYLNEASIHKEYWGDTEELTFEEFDDGSVLIREGDTAMGWTTIDAIKTQDISPSGFRKAEEQANQARYNNIQTAADNYNIDLKDFENLASIDDKIKSLEKEIGSAEDILNQNNPATSSQINLDELSTNKELVNGLKAIRKNIVSDRELCEINGLPYESLNNANKVISDTSSISAQLSSSGSSSTSDYLYNLSLDR